MSLSTLLHRHLLTLSFVAVVQVSVIQRSPIHPGKLTNSPQSGWFVREFPCPRRHLFFGSSRWFWEVYRCTHQGRRQHGHCSSAPLQDTKCPKPWSCFARNNTDDMTGTGPKKNKKKTTLTLKRTVRT